MVGKSRIRNWSAPWIYIITNGNPYMDGITEGTVLGCGVMVRDHSVGPGHQIGRTELPFDQTKFVNPGGTVSKVLSIQITVSWPRLKLKSMRMMLEVSETVAHPGTSTFHWKVLSPIASWVTKVVSLPAFTSWRPPPQHSPCPRLPQVELPRLPAIRYRNK